MKPTLTLLPTLVRTALLLGASAAAISTSSTAFAQEASPACAAKRAAIQSQIEEASARGRSQELAGLQRALAANQAHCSDASLAKAREADIRAAQEKVAEREKSLAEAERKGNAKKIAKRKAKLAEARRDLAEAEKPLPRKPS